jgi:hypothetical protein
LTSDSHESTDRRRLHPVSRRGGREGESFISPDVQRTKIEGWARLHDVEIVQ